MILFLPRTLPNWCSQSFLNRHAFLKPSVQRSAFDSNFGRPVSYVHRLSLKFNYMKVGVRWCGQDFFNRPPVIQAAIQRLKVDSNFGSPICQTESFSLKRNHPNEIAILGLLFWRCPSAVFRRISFRAIDPVDAVRCGWFRPHIGIEVLKRFPSRAYCFSVSSISWKGFRVRVIAALVHCFPANVFWCSVHAMSLSACLATVAAVPSESAPANRSFCSALADNIPVDILRWMVCRLTKNRPFTELLAGQVFEIRGATSRIAASHLNLLNRFKVFRSARTPTIVLADRILSLLA